MNVSTSYLNLNETDIWKRIDNVGYTKYINVVDGTERNVPWGTLDYWNIITGNIMSFAILGGLIWLGIHYLVK